MAARVARSGSHVPLPEAWQVHEIGRRWPAPERFHVTNQPRQPRVEVDDVPAERGIGLTQDAIA